MEIEQKPPNQPNFKLIGILSLVVMLVLFVVVVFVLRVDGRHLIPHHVAAKTSSALRLAGEISLCA
jgi:hypothetical protein